MACTALFYWVYVTIVSQHTPCKMIQTLTHTGVYAPVWVNMFQPYCYIIINYNPVFKKVGVTENGVTENGKYIKRTSVHLQCKKYVSGHRRKTTQLARIV